MHKKCYFSNGGTTRPVKRANMDAKEPAVTITHKSILKARNSPANTWQVALREIELDGELELTSPGTVNHGVNVVAEHRRRAEERRRLSDAIARMARKNWQRNRRIDPSTDAAIMSRRQPEISVGLPSVRHQDRNVTSDLNAHISSCGPNPVVVHFDEVVLAIDDDDDVRTVSEVPLNDGPSVFRSRKRSALLPGVKCEKGDGFLARNNVVKSISSCTDNESEATAVSGKVEERQLTSGMASASAKYNDGTSDFTVNPIEQEGLFDAVATDRPATDVVVVSRRFLGPSSATTSADGNGYETAETFPDRCRTLEKSSSATAGAFEEEPKENDSVRVDDIAALQ